MRLKIALAALGTVVASALVPPATAHADDIEPLIIGGGTVSSAPWSAQVLSSGRFTCSGTIIAPTWVLTARHCVGGSMSVRIGNVRLGSGTLVTVTSSRSQADIAVMRLSRAVNTQFSPLATSDPPVNATNSIYGWGRTCIDCPASPQLKTANVRVVGFTTDAYGGRAIASNRINGNAWKGDSGGPQYYNGRQVGVASTANGTTRQNYGSVAANRSFIRSVTGV